MRGVSVEVAPRHSVTLEAPRHLERIALPRDLHLLNRSVADVAVNAPCDVDAVVEKHETGQPVYGRPFDWRTGLVALANRLKHWRVRPDLRVARHTRLGWRNVGKAGFLN